MTAPETTESEPTLSEAFGELAGALADEDEGGGTATEEEAPPTEEEQGAAEPEKEEESPKAPGAPAPEAPPEPGQAKQATPDKTATEPERQPLTYTVDGQQRSFDGAFVLPGLGAVISNEALPRLQDRLQQADRLVAQNQVLYQQSNEFSKLGGRAAFDKLSADKAMLDASATLLLRALSDEATLVTLATDPVARQQLIKEIHITAREAQFNATNLARETYARETEQSSTAQRTQTAIHNAVGALAQEFSGLTEDDISMVRSHASRMHAAIVRPATPEEAREANVQVGAPIIDLPILHALLADRHALRATAVEQAKRSQTDALENAARAAAAHPTTVANGNRPPAAPRPGAGKPRAAPPAKQKTLDEMSSGELTRAMKSGRIFDLIGDDEQ